MEEQIMELLKDYSFNMALADKNLTREKEVMYVFTARILAIIADESSSAERMCTN